MRNQLHSPYPLQSQGFTPHIHGHKQYFPNIWHPIPEPDTRNKNTNNTVTKVLTETMELPVSSATESFNLKI